MSSAFNIITESYLLLTIIFFFSALTLSSFRVHTDLEPAPESEKEEENEEKTHKDDALFFKCMVLPAVLIFLLSVSSNDFSIYKLVLLSETIFYFFASICIVNKRNIYAQVILGFAFLFSFLFIFFDSMRFLSELTFKYYAIFHLFSIGIFYFSAEYAKSNQKIAKISFINALSTVLLLLFYGNNELILMLLLRGVFFLLLFKELLIYSELSSSRLEKKYLALKKNFDDEVKLGVKKQMFYANLSNEKMAELAKLDDLTKTYNRRAITNFIKEYIADPRVKTFSLLIFDIDKFKSINDSLGHIEGDKHIIAVSKIAKESLREKDILGRYGGDEFFAIIYEADLKSGAQIAERIRKNVQNAKEVMCTISIGIANYPHDAQTFSELIKHADDGLYLAKNKGRNNLGYLSKIANSESK